MKTNNAITFAALGCVLFGLSQHAVADGGSITLEARCYIHIKDSTQIGDRKIIYNTQFCGVTNKSGAGFMHEVSLHGPVWSESSPVGNRLFGHNVIVDKEDDEIYMSIERRGIAPDPGVGRWTITGGTGKYAGASGSGTYSVDYLPTIVEGSLLNIATLKGQYQLP